MDMGRYMDGHGFRDRDRDRDIHRQRESDMNTASGYHIWDMYKGQLLQKFHNSLPFILDLKISGDGSKIFRPDPRCIAAMSMQRGEEEAV